MLGQLKFSPGGRGKIAQGRLYGLPVLRAEADPEGMFASHRLRRAGKGLRRGGAGRVLAPAGFEDWPALERFGLAPVEAVPFVRWLSAPLALELMARKGKKPAGATVALRGLRADRDMVRTAEELCQQVRRLVIDAPRGGEELAKWLRWEFGVPVLPPGAEANLALRFHPEAREREESALSLYGSSPDLAGLSLSAPRLEREDREDLPLLAALWEGGRLSRGDIKIT